ncbi:MAG: hypothetical protein Q7U92_04540, partial [Bradyrhizobium sp.]|nr:hypothetical protein [Bradyrhizobium sp.]
ISPRRRNTFRICGRALQAAGYISSLHSSSGSLAPGTDTDVPVMTMRRWALLIGVILIGAIAAIWYYDYRSKCHGIDECAARAAEGHERDTPTEHR